MTPRKTLTIRPDGPCPPSPFIASFPSPLRGSSHLLVLSENRFFFFVLVGNGSCSGCFEREVQREGGRVGKMNVNRNYYEMQLEGHPLAPAEVEVSDRQLDRFRELVRRGKGRRDFDDDCFYEVWSVPCVCPWPVICMHLVHIGRLRDVCKDGQAEARISLPGRVFWWRAQRPRLVHLQRREHLFRYIDFRSISLNSGTAIHVEEFVKL